MVVVTIAKVIAMTMMRVVVLPIMEAGSDRHDLNRILRRSEMPLTKRRIVRVFCSTGKSSWQQSRHKGVATLCHKQKPSLQS